MSARAPQQLAPIAVFVYKRAEHTRRMLQSLRANPDFARSPVTVYCDGARSADDREAVEATRRIVRELAPAARIVERDGNFGLARSIITGVTENCAKYGRVIVCEDDLVFSPFALDYFNDALDFYAGHERVMHISGYMYPVRRQLPKAFLYREGTCWGWATWQRAWEKFEPDARSIMDWVGRNDRRSAFDINDTMYFWQMLTMQAEGRLDSWAIRWYGSIFKNDGLSLHPGRALVANKGHDGTGVHCGATSEFEVELAHEPLPEHAFPTVIAESEAVVRAMMDYRKPSDPRGLLRRTISWGRHQLGTARRALWP